MVFRLPRIIPLEVKLTGRDSALQCRGQEQQRSKVREGNLVSLYISWSRMICPALSWLLGSLAFFYTNHLVRPQRGLLSRLRWQPQPLYLILFRDV